MILMLRKINHIISDKYSNSLITCTFSFFAFLLPLTQNYYNMYDDNNKYNFATAVTTIYIIYDTSHNIIHLIKNKNYNNITSNNLIFVFNQRIRHIELIVHHVIFGIILYLSYSIRYNYFHSLILEMSTFVLTLSRLVKYRKLKSILKHLFIITWIHNRFIYLPVNLYEHTINDGIPIGTKICGGIGIGLVYIMSTKWTCELFLSDKQKKHALNSYSSVLLLMVPQCGILLNTEYKDVPIIYEKQYHYVLCILVLCSALNHSFYHVMNKYYRYIQIADISCINYFSIGFMCKFDFWTLIMCNGLCAIIKLYHQNSKLHHIFFGVALLKLVYLKPYIVMTLPILYNIIRHNLMHHYIYKITWHLMCGILIYHIIYLSSTS